MSPMKLEQSFFFWKEGVTNSLFRSNVSLGPTIDRVWGMTGANLDQIHLPGVTLLVSAIWSSSSFSEIRLKMAKPELVVMTIAYFVNLTLSRTPTITKEQGAVSACLALTNLCTGYRLPSNWMSEKIKTKQ
jgi:hypothetical protein